MDDGITTKNSFKKWKIKKKISILLCTSQYPTPFNDVHLRAMKSLRERYGVKVGLSDHTVGIHIPIAAVALGATLIEKHFTQLTFALSTQR